MNFYTFYWAIRTLQTSELSYQNQKIDTQTFPVNKQRLTMDPQRYGFGATFLTIEICKYRQDL